MKAQCKGSSALVPSDQRLLGTAVSLDMSGDNFMKKDVMLRKGVSIILFQLQGN